ncbi:aa3-type cytochrome c oxidase subunit IV [Celeribacter indicus]|uniref:Aa3 type cytochrome c oxidase subunit IV n=1 Tax=Celeribacter indicus TaxID=1208324 RepID=A0A0B5E6C6_9RHOB|nr:aa3-type cytochrome c oxidase subunit IV [Celeribacter indicus]AJE48985.1 aa3 type cytochrome c oxidase subunit IV [Celeribacter indicus]SDW42987.1 aa3 type cytochrome c oxidase subunit IV [Celeribacter indicus]
MSDYKHGEMDITAQEKTFNGFLKAATYVAGASVVVLLFLAIFNS